jgi:hypothetical protein
MFAIDGRFALSGSGDSMASNRRSSDWLFAFGHGDSFSHDTNLHTRFSLCYSKEGA